jgi:hypothetical protein
VEAATSRDRQRFVFDKVLSVIDADFGFTNKDEARQVLMKISSMFRDWNYAPWNPSVIPESERQDKDTAVMVASDDQGIERGDFKKILEDIDSFIQSKSK